MTLQIFELEKGKTFVAGLFWQTLSRPQNLKDEVRKLAADLDFNLYIIREASVPQVGLMTTADGGAANQMSCAAIVSKTIEVESGYTSALCAIQVPGDDRYLFVAIRDGIILPDGDLIDSEEEIEKRFAEYQSIGDWPVRFAPEHWGITDSEERGFSSFLPKNTKGGVEYHKWWGVVDVAGDKRKLFKMAVMLAVIGTAIGMAYMFYQQYQQRQLEAAAAQQAEAEQRQKKEAYSNIKIDHPWTNIAPPAEAMGACEANFRSRYVFAAGWSLDSFTCDITGATYVWHRGKTTIGALKAVLPEVVGSDMGESATLIVPFALGAPQPDILPEAGASKAAFIEAMQRVDDNFSLTETPVTVPTPPDADGDFVPPAADYRAYHFAIPITKFSPRTIAAYLSIPSMRITKASTTLKDGVISWTYDGDLYEKI